MYQKRNNILEILSLYRRNYNVRLYLREISKLSKIPLKTCQNTLKDLENLKILKSKKEGKNKYFYLNLENIKSKNYLLQAEIYQTNVFIEKYPRFKLFLKELKNNPFILIFGSFAKFKANKNSDIDLLIISKNQEIPFHLLPSKDHQIRLKEKGFIEAVNKQNELIKEIEENHIILSNHSFYVNYMWDYYAK